MAETNSNTNLEQLPQFPQRNYRGAFRGIIIAVDEDHRQITMFNGKTRMIVQPKLEWWDFGLFTGWLSASNIVWATGRDSWSLPIIMNAHVSISEEDSLPKWER